MDERERSGRLTSAPGSVTACGSRVLLVDDDPGLLRLLRVLFERHGWRVCTAENGHDAIDALRTLEGVDLIVSDVDMPGMDGLEMCRCLAANGNGAPIILISGLQIEREIIDDAAGPIVGFLRKPVDPLELLQTAAESVLQ